MSVTQILKGLESSDSTGGDAIAAGQMGFLEWAFALPGAATPEAAREALAAAPPEVESAAARAFLQFLKQATVHVQHPTRRRRTARLH